MELLSSRGRIVMGWVGGGGAESAVRSEALKCIQSGNPALITLNMRGEVLGAGMPCGGMMDVYIELVTPAPELVRRLVRLTHGEACIRTLCRALPEV